MSRCVHRVCTSCAFHYGHLIVSVCDLARAYLSPEIIIFDSACKLGSETGGNVRMAAVTRVSLVVKLHDITCS